jgi:acyl-CoA thioesterase-1
VRLVIGRATIVLGLVAFEAALLATAACSEKHPTEAVDGASPSALALPPDASAEGAVSRESGATASDAGAVSSPGDGARDASGVPGDLDAGVRTLKGRYKTVLHLGDSEVGFGGGLTKALQRRFEARGIRFFSNSLTSAGIQSYEREERLPRMVKLYKPELVLLNLGTNNLSVPHPDVLAASIRNIAKKISTDGRECIWIGPPHLRAAAKSEAAMTKVIEENVAPCKYFDSSQLELQMQSDRIHPTDRGGDLWADQVWRFIVVGDEPSGPFRDAGAR